MSGFLGDVVCAWQVTKPVGEVQGLEDALQRASQGTDCDKGRRDSQEKVHSEVHGICAVKYTFCEIMDVVADRGSADRCLSVLSRSTMALSPFFWITRLRGFQI